MFRGVTNNNMLQAGAIIDYRIRVLLPNHNLTSLLQISGMDLTYLRHFRHQLSHGCTNFQKIFTKSCCSRLA